MNPSEEARSAAVLWADAFIKEARTRNVPVSPVKPEFDEWTMDLVEEAITQKTNEGVTGRVTYPQLPISKPAPEMTDDEDPHAVRRELTY